MKRGGGGGLGLIIKSIRKAKGHKTIEIVIVCLGSLYKQNRPFKKQSH